MASVARTASAGPGDAQAARGISAAKRGDCVKAVPLLEEAELKRHRPSSALALADCYVALGELLKASDLYHAIANEKPVRSFTVADRVAINRAKKKAVQVDARIPTLAFEGGDDYEGLTIELDGREVSNPEEPRKVPPDVQLTLVAAADGYEDYTEKIVLAEGERRVLTLRLVKLPAPKPAPKKPPRPATPADGPTTWIGAGFRSFLIPKFVFGAFGDGGRTLFVPGAGLYLTRKTADVDVVFWASYASFALRETPFLPSGHPDTDYEIIESDLQALLASAHIVFDVPIDDAGTFAFRVGGGLGVGWTFAGDLYRTQAYPPKGAGKNPYLYKKCSGPNDPAGSFRYCNALDYDAEHYFPYTEPSWFSGGARPLLFPWLALPEVGFAFRPSRGFAIDLQAGLSLTGLMTSLGVRFGL